VSAYVFHVGAGDGAARVVLHLSLESDVEAGVRSFDLLRAHPECEWAVVACGGEVILRRTRDGGKLTLVWAAGRPRRLPTQLRRRVRGQIDSAQAGAPGQSGRACRVGLRGDR